MNCNFTNKNKYPEIDACTVTAFSTIKNQALTAIL